MPTVLVVESHDDTRELLAEFFSWEGLDVLTAITTDDALAIADRADVVITALQAFTPPAAFLNSTGPRARRGAMRSS